jgi:chromosome segregation ATPase
MLWRNVATLFEKYDTVDTDVERQVDSTKRCMDEVYQELQELRTELEEYQKKAEEESQNATASASASASASCGSAATLVRKLKKYVNKKCEKLRETVTYGAYSADNEVFDYVNTTRSDLEAKNKKLEGDLAKLYEEMEGLNETYNSDYEVFIKRENDMMARLNEAVKLNEATNQRMTHLEDIIMKQIQQVRNHVLTDVVGDLREEFSKAICNELSFESKTNAHMIENVREELTDLITRSNEYHTARYFGTVEDVNQIRDTCQTLKQSIGMVDAELSDTKLTVEYLKDEVGQNTTDLGDLSVDFTELKDDVYREMDRDYYSLKNYVKRRITRHELHEHREESGSAQAAHEQAYEEKNALQLIAEEYEQTEIADTNTNTNGPAQQDRQYEEHIIIIDENTVFSDDEDEFKQQI